MRIVAWVIAALLIVAGGLWAAPGVGLIENTREVGTGATVLGSAAVGFGIALVIVLVQRRGG